MDDQTPPPPPGDWIGPVSFILGIAVALAIDWFLRNVLPS